MRHLLSISLLLSVFCARAATPIATFTENKGQWPGDVLYRVMLPNGALFIEKQAFTYVLHSGGRGHDHAVSSPDHVEEPLKAHAFRVHFMDGRAQASVGKQRQAHYENYFLGNDPAQWGTGCAVFGEVVLKDVWPGIDLRLDGSTGLKYELLVQPGADPSVARLRYEGQDQLELRNGELLVTTTAGQLIEEAPFSFQESPTGTRTVDSKYRLAGDELTFELSDGYNTTLPLTIDPTIAFASYSGSTGNNFGFTATYDAAGHLYGGGIVFAQGYPTTLGVLDATFNGGTIDVGISKWTTDGSGLEWSTYYGGSGNESPHSMVVNDDDELFVLGSTGSADLPTTVGCVDNSFGGGPGLTFIIGYGYDQPLGTDMFVAHFNSTATALIGSTFIGGPANDGINNAPELAHNYGDSFRGEIIMDLAGNPVVASTTASAGLPTIGGPQAVYGGGAQDGYCFRLDPGLTTVLWATYIGGSGADAAYGVQVDSNGELFVAGGTASANLPMAGTSFQPAFSGATDGFIMRYGLAGTLSGSTYLGTAAYDQCYFVQLNTADEVFVVGQTRGNYPVTPGKYTNPGSSQFIHKLGHGLGNSLWSTRFGNGTSDQDLSPTAFLVSDCGQIYFSGWGGSVNFGAGNLNSTTVGLPVTADAFQSTTDGSDLYLMLLEPEAVGLNYATFFGGAQSPEHVDGGTSRFDKNGTVYQAVCAGCQNLDDFPTTPGAWSNTNNAFGCNLGVMKFDLARGVADISIDGPNEICLPGIAQFINNSEGGNSYAWNFGNGTTSTLEEPSIEYLTADTFVITMILTDTTGCRASDTASLQVITIPPPMAVVDPVDPICLGLSVQLQASGGDTYVWFPVNGLDDPLIPDPVLTPISSGTWSVVVTTQCGNDTAEVVIDLSEPQGSAGDDVRICTGDSVQLVADGGGTYLWSPVGTLSDPAVANPIATPSDTTTYTVVITSPVGCVTTDSMIVIVLGGLPEPALEDSLVCFGNSIQLIGPAADSYVWEVAPGITTLNVANPIVAPSVSTTYVLLASNLCGSIRDSAFVAVIIPEARAWPDTLVCPGEPVMLHASGGTGYAWTPSSGLDDATSPTPMATVFGPLAFTVTTTDEYGCMASASVALDTHPMPTVRVGPDQVVDFGDEAQLTAVGIGTFEWEPSDWLDCTDCPAPVARPEQSLTYTVTLTDPNGCKVRNTITVLLNGTLFVPNTFTPNGDGYNDAWGAWGSEIKDFRILVFDRWGTRIFRGESLDSRWDGTYGGQDAPIDTYVWRVDLVERAGRKRTLYGHVNLVR